MLADHSAYPSAGVLTSAVTLSVGLVLCKQTTALSLAWAAQEAASRNFSMNGIFPRPQGRQFPHSGVSVFPMVSVCCSLSTATQDNLAPVGGRI